MTNIIELTVVIDNVASFIHYMFVTVANVRKMSYLFVKRSFTTRFKMTKKTIFIMFKLFNVGCYCINVSNNSGE